MVQVDELLTFFKANKTQNKNDPINNVHKPYEAFRYIYPEYVSQDVTTLLNNIDDFYNKAMVPNYRPNTIKNYLRDLLWSLDLNVIQNNIPNDIILATKTKLKTYIQQADKVANEVKKSSPPSSKSSSKESEESDLNIDINEILPTKDSDSEDTSTEEEEEDDDYETSPPNMNYVSQDKLMTNYIILQTENEMLRDQVAWLRSLVESMTCAGLGTRLRRPDRDH